MPNRETMNNMKALIAFKVQAISSSTTTAGDIAVDLQGYDSATILFFTGTITDGDYAIEIKEGDTTTIGSHTAVADADLTVTEASIQFTDNADDNKCRRIGYTGSKRYLSVHITSTNVTTGGTLGAIAVLEYASQAPVAQGS